MLIFEREQFKSQLRALIDPVRSKAVLYIDHMQPVSCFGLFDNKVRRVSDLRQLAAIKRCQRLQDKTWMDFKQEPAIFNKELIKLRFFLRIECIAIDLDSFPDFVQRTH